MTAARRTPRVVAIVQARMGSTRLPGKVLRPIAGRPLLWHVVHRLRRARTIDDIAIATTVHPRDDAIAAFAREEGIEAIRGPEDNVLARFATAAKALGAEVIVRVSADAPFIDPGFVDHLVNALIAEGGDYVMMEEGTDCAHDGVDPFSRGALDRLAAEAADDPVAREHVTGYFKLHPRFVHVVRARAYPPLARKAPRLTIDTPDDLAFAEAVHARLAARAGEAALADLLLLLERAPELGRINAHVRQKAATQPGALALIRCDGGGRLGYGHVTRMRALARALRDSEGIGIVIALHGSGEACAPLREAGFETVHIPDGTDDVPVLAQLIGAHDPDILVCDLREGIGREALTRLARDVTLTAVIDDASPRRLAADLAYYSPVPQAFLLDWTGAATQARIGWEWVILGSAPVPARPRPPMPRPTLLVTMGGSDPLGLTLRAAKALVKLGPRFRARFVVGPGMVSRADVAHAIRALSPHFETVEGAYDLSAEYANCDLALAAFGVTSYELAASGVPAIYICLTEDHALSASAFHDAGLGLSLGTAAGVTDETIGAAVSALLDGSARRAEMRAAGLMTIDGGGAARVARDLAGALAARRGLKSAQSAG